MFEAPGLEQAPCAATQFSVGITGAKVLFDDAGHGHGARRPSVRLSPRELCAKVRPKLTREPPACLPDCETVI